MVRYNPESTATVELKIQRPALTVPASAIIFVEMADTVQRRQDRRSGLDRRRQRRYGAFEVVGFAGQQYKIELSRRRLLAEDRRAGRSAAAARLRIERPVPPSHDALRAR
jgi:hypothetical protein